MNRIADALYCALAVGPERVNDFETPGCMNLVSKEWVLFVVAVSCFGGLIQAAVGSLGG